MLYSQMIETQETQETEEPEPKQPIPVFLHGF